MPATATTILSIVLNCTPPTIPPPTNSSTAAPYDAEGAMKFTVAVVFVFGVGVIGMLGIYHKRNVNEELSDKEADEFVKRFEGKRYNLDKQYRKQMMRQLVESFFARTLEMQSQNNRQRKSVRFSLRPTLSEPNLLQCSSLLTDCHNDSGDSCAQTTDRQQQRQASQDQSAENLLPDPAPPEARSRSRSFHVPRARAFPGLSRKNAVERAKLNFKKAQLKNGAESELPLLSPEKKPHLNGQSTPSTCLLPTRHRRADNINIVNEEQDSPRLGLSVQMGGSLVVPTILVNDVQVS